MLNKILITLSIIVIIPSLAWGASQVCFSSNCVTVEVVSSAAEMARGLSSRTQLKDDTGMLFVFSVEGPYRFWMKDMKFPLDIIWINDKKEIVAVAEDLTPCLPNDCPLYTAPKNARYVLEVNAGYAKKHNIRQGIKATLKSIK